MGRILAIDYGKKRTGLAVTDECRIIANGLTTVRTHLLVDFLRDYMKKEKVDFIVMGKPLQTNGEASENMQRIEQFMKHFKKVFPNVEVVMHDERFTSVLAHQAMIDGGLGMKRRREKALVDEISATIILQSFMESRQYSETYSTKV